MALRIRIEGAFLFEIQISFFPLFNVKVLNPYFKSGFIPINMMLPNPSSGGRGQKLRSCRRKVEKRKNRAGNKLHNWWEKEDWRKKYQWVNFWKDTKRSFKNQKFFFFQILVWIWSFGLSSSSKISWHWSSDLVSPKKVRTHPYLLHFSLHFFSHLLLGYAIFRLLDFVVVVWIRIILILLKLPLVWKRLSRIDDQFWIQFILVPLFVPCKLSLV